MMSSLSDTASVSMGEAGASTAFITIIAMVSTSMVMKSRVSRPVSSAVICPAPLTPLGAL